MPIFQRDNYKILFVHIPKTGGNYIYKNLQNRGFILDPLSWRRKKSQNPIPLQHQTYQELCIRYDINSFDKIFSITRNPIDRLVSEYNWKKRGRRKNINDWIKLMFNNYLSNNSIEDNHIRPQIDFIGDNTIHFKYEDGLDNAINNLFSSIDQQKLFLKKAVNVSNKKVTVDDLSPNSIKLIKTFYKEDFYAFNYI